MIADGEMNTRRDLNSISGSDQHRTAVEVSGVTAMISPSA